MKLNEILPLLFVQSISGESCSESCQEGETKNGGVRNCRAWVRLRTYTLRPLILGQVLQELTVYDSEEHIDKINPEQYFLRLTLSARRSSGRVSGDPRSVYAVDVLRADLNDSGMVTASIMREAWALSIEILHKALVLAKTAENSLYVVPNGETLQRSISEESLPV